MPRAKAKQRTGPTLEPANLAEWQRVMHLAITRPLARGDRMQRHWLDGRSTASAMARLVRPSRALKPVERVEIYNRMYWFRLLDSFAQDYPGLRALLGERKFWQLAECYLAAYPSRSYTLRNLGSRLVRFLAANPGLVAPAADAAREMARFEWAQIVAFDGPARPCLTRRALATGEPGALRLGIQPYVTILSGRYPVDEYVMALKRDGALRSGASNAVGSRSEGEVQAIELRKGQRVHLAVHRMDNQLYYKRLEPRAARLLRALRSGKTVAEACAKAFANSGDDAAVQTEKVRSWFSLWMRLGWLCERE
jgi:hypothetical protein